MTEVKRMKRFVPVLLVFTLISVFCSCSVIKNKGAAEPDTSSHIIDDSVTFKAQEGEVLIADGRNYYVLTFENDRVKSTAYALHFLDPDSASAMYDTYKKDMGSLYTDVRLDGTYLILTYSDENENSLNGLSRALIEQTYGDKIMN